MYKVSKITICKNKIKERNIKLKLNCKIFPKLNKGNNKVPNYNPTMEFQVID